MIKDWGFYDEEHFVYAEQITINKYLVNAGGKINLYDVEIELPKDKKGKDKHYLDINNRKYYLSPRRISVKNFYTVPGIDECQLFLGKEIKVRNIEEILKDLKAALKTLFEFTQEKDVILISLFIAQSFLKPVVDEFFFVGIDATKGGGKTTLLEIISLLSRHGMLAGDMSPASIPRLVEQFDLALAMDELDERIGKGEEDSVAILRKGQRKGNKYIRVNKHSMNVETFDVAGTHCFTFRSELEDALISRSLHIHSRTTSDNRLAIINFYKSTLLQRLQEELFFWGVREIPKIGYKVKEAKKAVLESLNVVGNSRDSREFGHSYVQQQRDNLFKKITEKFTTKEKKLLESLVGRNSELAFLLIRLTRLLEINLEDEIATVIKEKQEQQTYNTPYYQEALKEYLIDHYNELKDQEIWKLKSGTHTGFVFTPKSLCYRNFSTFLKNNNVNSIGHKPFTSLLRDLGFVEGVNINSQRPAGKYPTACLIFDEDIQKNLDIDTILPLQEKIIDYVQANQGLFGVDGIDIGQIDKELGGLFGFDNVISKLLTNGILMEVKPGRVKTL